MATTAQKPPDAPAEEAPVAAPAGPSPAAELRRVLTAVDDAVAGLGGDIGSLAAVDSTHIGPVAGRHAELQQLLAGLRAAAERLDK